MGEGAGEPISGAYTRMSLFVYTGDGPITGRGGLSAEVHGMFTAGTAEKFRLDQDMFLCIRHFKYEKKTGSS